MSVNAIESQRFGLVEGSSNIFDKTSPARLSDDQLAERVVGYASQIAALTAQFLDLLVELDNRRVWNGEGIRSCAHWLSWRTGLSLRTAQDHLRIAHALTELPQLHAAFADGRLSYSKVRALTRVATPERELELLNVALSATAAQVEYLVRTIKHIDRTDDETTTDQVDSTARWRWNDDGTLSVTMRLQPVDGARFLAGVVRSEYERSRTTGDPDLSPDFTDGHPTDAAPARADLWRHVPSDIADAVVAMSDAAATMIDMPAFAPGAEIVIHTDADNETDPHLDGGPAVSENDVDEAACGGSTRTVGHQHRRHHRKVTWGVAMAWGRKRRIPTRTLLGALFERDRGCRHPGCGRTRHLHAHHVRFWRDGGTTDPDNLILLCSTHHRALHNGAFSITACGDQQFSFHRTDGSVIEIAPTTSTPSGWQPDTTIAPDAVEPTGGGRLDLGYTTEVLYAAWQLRTARNEQPLAA